MVNTIWFRVDLIRFRKDLCVCVLLFTRDGTCVWDLISLTRGSNQYIIWAQNTHTPDEQFCNINWDIFKRVCGILVNWIIATMYFDERIAHYILIKILVEMCKFTGIKMNCLNVLFMLPNCSEGGVTELDSQKLSNWRILN